MAARPESAALALPVGGVDEIEEAACPVTENWMELSFGI